MQAAPMTRATLCGLALAAATFISPAQEAAAPQKEFRAARSVHLGWPAPDGEWFYNEITVEESTPGSYFMVCGWNTGYFGLQEIREGRDKVVIFSVWDPTVGDDPNAVKSEDRVEVLHSDPEARIRRFGGEGTGGQCMVSHDWKIGERYKFLLQGKVEGEKTAYAAYFYDNGGQSWRHLATFRTRTKGLPLRGYYSFVEDFRRDFKSVHATRRARFGNGWVMGLKGDWTALTRARFTGSGAEWESKENIDAGLAGKDWFLATGGAITMSRPLGTILTNAPILLPAPPAAP